MPSVLHIVPALFSSGDGILGGAERYALELARHMADVLPTRLVTFGDRGREERVGNLSIHVLEGSRYVRGQRTNPIAPKLFGEIRHADIVHCHQQHVLASSLTALFCWPTKRRVYVTDLGGGGWDISSYVSTDSWFDGHLHISEYSRRVYHHENLKTACVILGGVDTKRFSPAEVGRRNTVVYAGRLLPHKGVDGLIKALPPRVELELIGHAYEPRYLADLHRLAKGKQINFRHNCDDDDLVEAYRTASCVILPSVYKTMYGDETIVPELLGQTLLEAMACAAPVIATNVASLPEVVVDGVNGFLVAPGDTAALHDRIEWLVEHPKEAASMGVAGRQRVIERFTWPAVVDRCLSAYQIAA